MTNFTAWQKTIRLKLLLLTAGALLIIVPVLAGCRSDAVAGLIPAADGIAGVTMAPDDIVATPGGPAYRANVHQQGEENPWPPVDTSEVTLENDSLVCKIRYRQSITTWVGSTRNNMIHLSIPGKMAIDEMNLVVDNNNACISVIRSRDWDWSGLGSRSVLLVITVLPDAKPGKYSFGIEVDIDGSLLGVLPCRIEVIRDSFDYFLEPSAHEVSLEEASALAGRAVPVPGYLPPSYNIREIFAYGEEVILLVSDREIEKELVAHTDAAGFRNRFEFSCRMAVTIRYLEDGFCIPPYKVPGASMVEVYCAQTGIFIPKQDSNNLWFSFQPEQGNKGIFVLEITANLTVPFEQVVAIARSCLIT
ncbi:MAG: hypothetical protein JW954_08035 [Dehalococcoidaceae bacterium]|nr:hypothetical protein [Dehalococcoidaceae bacterium]